MDQARAKKCHHRWTSLSPVFFQLLLDHYAYVLSLDEIYAVNTAFLKGSKNRTPWTMICKMNLHFCNGVSLLSELIIPPVWCTLPHHGYKEEMVGIFMVSKKKVMSNLFFFPACTKKLNQHIPQYTQYDSHAKCLLH